MKIENWETQLRKGLIEFYLLNLIHKRNQCYGKELMDRMTDMGLTVTEGTLYPLVSRLERAKILTPQWMVESEGGRPRKYYRLSDEGYELLKKMNTIWDRSVFPVHRLTMRASEGLDTSIRPIDPPKYYQKSKSPEQQVKADREMEWL